jgi:hypothetical protein
MSINNVDYYKKYIKYKKKYNNEKIKMKGGALINPATHMILIFQYETQYNDYLKSIPKKTFLERINIFSSDKKCSRSDNPELYNYKYNFDTEKFESANRKIKITINTAQDIQTSLKNILISLRNILNVFLLPEVIAYVQKNPICYNESQNPDEIMVAFDSTKNNYYYTIGVNNEKIYL